MKHLIVIAAGLGYEDLDRRGLKKMAGLEFRPAESVFPAVTCVAQATFRTAAEPCDHGMVSNGFFSRKLLKPSFWEQSAALVAGPRIWDAARAGGAIRDWDVIDCCNDAGVAMVFTGQRSFRH